MCEGITPEGMVGAQAMRCSRHRDQLPPEETGFLFRRTHASSLVDPVWMQRDFDQAQSAASGFVREIGTCTEWLQATLFLGLPPSIGGGSGDAQRSLQGPRCCSLALQSVSPRPGPTA